MFSLPSIEIILFQIFVFAFFGALLGSFASAIIHRIETEQSWIFNDKENEAARSQCPQCDHQLSWKDLIPLISYLLLKGQCRYCKSKIPAFYFLLEITCIIVALCIYKVFGFSTAAFLVLAVWPFILSQAFVFYRRNIISKQLCAIIGFGFIALGASYFI